MRIAVFAAACLTVTVAHAQPDPLEKGLVLWLDFNEVTDGGFLNRTGGTGCDVSGMPRVQDGALLVSQFETVSVPDLDTSSAAAQLTVAAWVAPSERPTSYQSILYKGKRQGAGVQEIHFYLSLFDGRPEFKFKDERGVWQGIMRNGDVFSVPGGAAVPVSQVPAIPALRWSHIAASFDRGQLTLYLNGEPTLTGQTPTDQLVPNSHPLLIGEAQAEGGPRSYLFRGLVDDVRVYDRALSEAELAALYTSERPGKPEGPLTIERPLPEGYDPEFKTRLPLVEAYEANLPDARPGDQPVTASVQMHGGYPTVHVDGQPVYGMAMMPEPYASDEMIHLSCRDFAAAGVDIYSEILWSWATPREGCHGWWLAEGEYDFERIDRRIRAIIAANPRALVFPRCKLNPPKWWLAEHPDEIVRNEDGSSGGQASLASELWEQTYERMLRDLIRHMEGSDYRGHIIGYHPAGGNASEWFWWGQAGHSDYSPVAVARFRHWLAERYGDVAALRRAWGDEALTFETVQPPSVADRQRTDVGILRDPVRGRPVADYRSFLSDMISRNIVRSCRIVKEETGGKKIAGVFYGYSLYSITQDGFQGLAEVLAAPEVDFLCSPTAYDHRRGGEVGGFVSAYSGSYRLHHKLFFDEVDTRTHLYPGHESYRTESLPETLAVVQRAAGYSLTKGTQLWWFLLAGNATFHQAEVMDAVAHMRAACEPALAADRHPVAQVAVFGDEPSMHYAGGDYQVRRAFTRDTLDELACMGAPFDTYLLSDIADPDLPDYKLYIFLNAWMLDDATRRGIAEVVRREGRTAVWVFAPGYLTAEGCSEQAMAELTGITIRAGAGEVPMALTPSDAGHAITAAMPAQWDWHRTLAPGFTVADPDATVLGTSNGQATLAVREFGDWRSVYSMLPLRREMLQGLCRYAGVHLYSESLDPFDANAGYAMIHTATEGDKRIVLPAPADVTELVTGREVGEGVTVIEEHLPAAVTRIYRLER